MAKVQVGAAKRLGKRSTRGTSEGGSNSVRGVCGSGAGDGTVATQALTTGNGRWTAGMSSVVICV